MTITMNEIVQMALVFTAGLVLGVIFFGGLWFTVKKSVSSKTPALWIFSSFIFRMGTVVLGFYYIARLGWQAMLICLIGFLTGRIIIQHFTSKHNKKQIQLNYETKP